MARCYVKVIATALFLVASLTTPVARLYASDVILSEEDAHVLYNEAITLFYNKKYKAAIAAFSRVEMLYPFSQMAIDGSYMSAIANYELGNYKESETLADGYISIYPNSPVIEHAYYVRFLAKYMQVPDLGLDQSVAHEVLELAEEFTKMFPESVHYASIAERLVDIRNHVAAKEFLVGMFYLRRGEYIAAVGRFSELVSKYSFTRYYQESIYRLSQAYMALGDEKTSSMWLEKLEDGVWLRRAKQSALFRKPPASSKTEADQLQEITAEKIKNR